MRNRQALVALAVVLGILPTGAFAQGDQTQPVFVQEDTGPVYRLTDGTVIRFGRTPPADNVRIDVREALRPQIPHGPATPPAYCLNASPYC